MAFEQELEALGAQLENAQRGRAAALLAALRAAAYKRRTDAYAACFLDATGELTPAARIVIADLCKLAGMGAAPAGLGDAALREQQGARRTVLRIMEFLRIDAAKMRRLARKVRETRTND